MLKRIFSAAWHILPGVYPSQDHMSRWKFARTMNKLLGIDSKWGGRWSESDANNYDDGDGQ